MGINSVSSKKLHWFESVCGGGGGGGGDSAYWPEITYVNTKQILAFVLIKCGKIEVIKLMHNIFATDRH